MTIRAQTGEPPRRRPEPAEEPYDDHTPPLDWPEDVRYLTADDPRRVELERKHGRAPRWDDQERG